MRDTPDIPAAGIESAAQSDTPQPLKPRRPRRQSVKELAAALKDKIPMLEPGKNAQLIAAGICTLIFYQPWLIMPQTIL